LAFADNIVILGTSQDELENSAKRLSKAIWAYQLMSPKQNI